MNRLTVFIHNHNLMFMMTESFTNTVCAACLFAAKIMGM